MLSFEHRLMRALREKLAANGPSRILQILLEVVRDAVTDTRTSLDVRDFGAVGDNEAADMKPKPTEEYSPGWDPGKTFQHKYEYRSVGYCLKCGSFDHVGFHVCKPKTPVHPPVTVSAERFDQLLQWERWGRNTAALALNRYRGSLIAANALAIMPVDPPEGI